MCPAMAEHNLAPMTVAVWSDGRQGMIVMEKMAAVYRDLFPDVGDSGASAEREIVVPPERVQLSVIGVLERAIERGYVHNDNHGGNIGFDSGGRVVLFDLGFTVKRSLVHCPNTRNYVLAYSIMQLLEHYPPELKYDTVYYDLLYAIRQTRYDFGSCIRYANTQHLEAMGVGGRPRRSRRTLRSALSQP